jgi:asparaginyl-tRNA synthetase
MQHKLAIARLEAEVFKAGRKYLDSQGFLELFPPRIVRASGACENVNTLFEVSSNRDFSWFGTSSHKHQAYLAQTGQLYLEAFVPYFGKTFCTGPSFRAEAGNDTRHLTEFTMMEIEFKGNFDDLLKHIEGFVYAIIQDLLNLTPQKQEDLGLTNEIARLSKVKQIFPKLTYDEAIQKLGLTWGDDINSKKEQELVEMYDSHPLLITRYPDPLYDHGKEIEVEKFFNMLPDPENPGRVLSADLILPISGEAVGSAARIDDAKTLIQRLEHSKMFKRLEELGGSLDDFKWYIDRVKEKTVPHAGCGFGMSRILRWIANTDDIKKAVTFPSNQEHII